MSRLRDWLRRLEREAERSDAPTWEEYWAAARRERARRLGAAYGRLAQVGGSPATHPGRDGRESLLEGDAPERAEADQRTVGAWEKAHGLADIKGAADEARAKLLV